MIGDAITQEESSAKRPYLFYGSQRLAMSLNNNGDLITLVGPGNEPMDFYEYTSSQEDVWIQTEH